MAITAEGSKAGLKDIEHPKKKLHVNDNYYYYQYLPIWQVPISDGKKNRPEGRLAIKAYINAIDSTADTALSNPLSHHTQACANRGG